MSRRSRKFHKTVCQVGVEIVSPTAKNHEMRIPNRNKMKERMEMVIPSATVSGNGTWLTSLTPGLVRKGKVCTRPMKNEKADRIRKIVTSK